MSGPREDMAATHSKTLGLDCRFNPASKTVVLAQQMVGRPYQLGSLGPISVDGYTLIRGIISLVVDEGLGSARRRALPIVPLSQYRLDFPPGSYNPADRQLVEPDAHALEEVLVAAGMDIVPGRGGAHTRPGDVVLSLGQGPAGAIVISPWTQDRGEVVVCAWPGRPVAARSDSSFGRSRVRVYRWPEPKEQPHSAWDK
jgi:hypothetical protein